MGWKCKTNDEGDSYWEYEYDRKYNPTEVIEDVTFDRKCFVHLGYDVRYNPNFLDKQKLVYLKQRGSNVTSFIMPSSYEHNGKRFVIRRIGSRCFAFYNEKKYKITKIGEKVFANCANLTSVTIPDSIEEIGNNAFSFCNSLTNITIPNSVIKIGNSVFSSCTSLIRVMIVL